MGELIQRERATHPIEFSGERLTSGATGQVEIEHYHRYLLARQFCRGLDVLDIASGEGYGTALIAQVARSVVGVEIDHVAVQASRSEFQKPNLSFEQGDARAIPLAHQSVDVIVSFETLEHLAEQEQFLLELRRVLRPGGMLVISTPDREIYSALGQPPNPFHVLELTRSEFEALLLKHFANITVSAQRTLIGSAIAGGGGSAALQMFERRSDTIIEASRRLSRAPYLVALASDAALPEFPDSLYVHRSDLDTDQLVRDQAERATIAAVDDAASARTQAEAAEIRAQAAEARTETARADTRAAQARVDESECLNKVAQEQLVKLGRETAAANDALAAADERVANAACRISVLEAERAKFDEAVRVLRQDLFSSSAQADSLAASLDQALARVENAEAVAVARFADVQALANEVNRSATRLLGAEHDLAAQSAATITALHHAREAEADLQRAEQAFVAEAAAHREARRALHDAGQRVMAMDQSTAWRATYPLRVVGKRFPTVARSLRLSAKVTWWAGTLQLPSRYRLWRTSKQLRLASAAPVPHLSAEPSGPVVALGSDHPGESSAAQTPLLDVGDIWIASSPEPVVSIVIATFGQVALTLACLRSIARNPPSTPFEVILVDDAYPGREVELLQSIPGIRFIRNPDNLGFLLSCNKAARFAHGRYIYLLNNDTELLSETADALVALLEERTDAGLAGSKLVFPNGLLQEAGGIIWADASGWNYGRGDDPARPEYNYVREVDYCSGASILVRKSVWERLGGFDEAFVPAYYEDADLAFRIRQLGLKVLFEPRSVVVHHEGMSHGTDLTSGIKAHQAANRFRMLERWAAVLDAEHYPDATHILRARDRARSRSVILVIDHYVPEPDRDAGSRSTMGILECLLVAGWDVKFWPQNRSYSPIYTPALEQLGIEVLDRRLPMQLREWIKVNNQDLDHVLVVRPTIAGDLLPHLFGRTDAKLSFYGVDLHFARMGRQAELEGDAVLLDEAAEMEKLERRVWSHFANVIYPSEEEAALVRTMVPGINAHSIVPFTFDIAPVRTVPTTRIRSVLFVAGFAHPPNVDAAIYLVRELLPIIEREVGPVELTLAGSNPSQAVLDLASPTIRVTGYQTADQLRAQYETHRCAIVPLRFGAGVKGKVVEALSYGLPVVTTSTGAQGIAGLAEVIPVHDDAPSIVAAIKLLLTEDDAWMAQSAKQHEFATKYYSQSAMRRSVIAALEGAEVLTNDSGDHASPLQITKADDRGTLEHTMHENPNTPISITDLQARALTFISTMSTLRQGLKPDFSWYPYDIVSNIWHLSPMMENLTGLFGPGKRIADVGAADGDLAFFLESLGNTCDIYDNPPTNMNGLEGAAALKGALNSAVTINALDLDTQFAIPRRYDLLVFLGILYHLKNPFYVLEQLASVSEYMLISTRITRHLYTGGPDQSHLPIAYLVGEDELNDDPTNYWVVTEAGLKRLVGRAGWDIVAFRTVGDTVGSLPNDNAHDERGFAILKSRLFR